MVIHKRQFQQAGPAGHAELRVEGEAPALRMPRRRCVLDGLTPEKRLPPQARMLWCFPTS